MSLSRRSLVAALTARSNRVASLFAAAQFEGSMNSMVRITRGGEADPAWDEVTKQVTRDSDETEIYGPETVPAGWDPIALVKTVSGPVTMTLADEPQYFQSTFIEIPLWANQPEVDDIVEILRSPDVRLVDRFYRVVDVEHAGQLPLYQRLQVVGIQPGRYWRQP